MRTLNETLDRGFDEHRATHTCSTGIVGPTNTLGEYLDLPPIHAPEPVTEGVMMPSPLSGYDKRLLAEIDEREAVERDDPPYDKDDSAALHAAHAKLFGKKS